ncbi:allatostatin-A receptor-like [Amphiura filiformis]|uniref:allatostatin-A receptor-like n=1 Tax=Amphiura filiformis TaxID=82378 RepID=UPI003B225B93
MEPVLYLRIAKTIIGLFGMIGNTLVCLVIHHNRDMHTFTNALIFNQAVTDFLSCIFIFLQSNIPNTGPPSSKIAGNVFCKFWDSPNALFALLVTSTFSLVVLTLERYVAIVFPFHYIKLFTLKKTVILICCIWILGFAHKLTDSRRFYMEDSACMMRQIPWIKGTGIIIFCVQYFLPILVMLFAYGHIIFVLSKNQRGRSTSLTSENRPVNTHPETLEESLKRARRNVLKTLILVFVAFVVCWTPNQLAYLFYNLGYNVTYGSTAFRITILMAQSNSAVNFIVYGFKYKQFRRGLRKLFRCPMSIEPAQPGSANIYTVT